MGTEPSRRKRGRPPHPDILTPREWQVLDLLRQGFTNEQIAQRLDISYATAKYHVSEIISKLGVATREEAADWQPEAFAVPWWRRAFAWVPRRAWPLAGVAGGFAALGVLVWILLITSADEADNVAQKAPSPSTNGANSTPTLPAPQALGPVLSPLADSSISEEGSYLVDIETGQIWNSDGFGIWSPDGTKMLRTFCCSGESGFDVIDFATGNAVRLLDEQVYSPAWSPDGREIAYRLFGSSASGDIFVISATGRESRKLSTLEQDGSLHWSPSGDYLVSFPYAGSGAHPSLISVPSGEVRTIPDSVDDLEWSPDGHLLAYGSSAGLFVIDVTSGAKRALVSGPTSSDILWAPDGSRLLATIDGTTQIVSLDSAGQVTDVPPGRYFTWSPDSTRIAYIGEGCTTNDWDVYVYYLTDGRQNKLTSTPLSSKEGLSWVSDNQSVVYSTGSQLLVANSGSLEERVLASVTSENAGYLHYHAGLRGLRVGSPSKADGRYAGFATSISGHGLCD